MPWSGIQRRLRWSEEAGEDLVGTVQILVVDQPKGRANVGRQFARGARQEVTKHHRTNQVAIKEIQEQLRLDAVTGLVESAHVGKSEVERVMGIEPTLSAWEAEVLPLNYTRVTVEY